MIQQPIHHGLDVSIQRDTSNLMYRQGSGVSTPRRGSGFPKQGFPNVAWSAAAPSGSNRHVGTGHARGLAPHVQRAATAAGGEGEEGAAAAGDQRRARVWVGAL